MTRDRALSPWRWAGMMLLALALTPGCARTTLPDPVPPEAVAPEARRAFGSVMRRIQASRRSGLEPETCRDLAGELHALWKEQRVLQAEFNRGVLLAECGEPDGARSAYGAVLRSRPDHLAALNNLAALELASGEVEKAVDLLARVHGLDPRFRPAQNNLGVARSEIYLHSRDEGAFERAMAHFQSALALQTDDPVAYENLARLLYERGRTGDRSFLLLAGLVADQGLRVLEATGGKSADLHNVKGLVLEAEHLPFAARRSFQRALAANPDHADAHFNLALLQVQTRSFEDARDGLNRAARDPRHAGDPELHLALGTALRGLRDYDGADRAYRRAMELDAKDPRPHFNLGVLEQDHLGTRDGLELEAIRSHYGTARRHYQQFVELAGDRPPLAGPVADARRRIRTIDDAFRIWDEVLAARGDVEALQRQLAAEEAWLRAREAEVREAVRAWERVHK